MYWRVLGEKKMKKHISIIKTISYRLYSGMLFAISPGMVYIFLLVLGYDLPELEFILISLMILFFLMGVMVPVRYFDTVYHDTSIDDLRNRLIDERIKSEKDKNILELMLSNMSELKQYYSISKLQARLAFLLAVIFCITGTIVLIVSILKFDGSNLQSTMISAIGGTISELFAGTALLVYKSTLKQLNIYYKSLHENERFLSIVNLANQLPDDRQPDAVIKIIESSLKDISCWVNSEE